MAAMTRTVELRRVVVTGIGVVSPVGIGKAPFMQSLLAGRSGIKRISRFDTTEFAVKIAGEITEFDPVDFIEKKMSRRLDRYAQYGVSAATLASGRLRLPCRRGPVCCRGTHRFGRRRPRHVLRADPSPHREGPLAGEPVLHPDDDPEHGVGDEFGDPRPKRTCERHLHSLCRRHERPGRRLFHHPARRCDRDVRRRCGGGGQ